MIDNSQQIIPLLKFEEGTFYCLQVLQRRKDNPGMTWQTKQRYFKFIRTEEEFKVFYTEDIELSNLYNARTYISLIPRSFEKLSLEALVELATRMKNKDFSNNFRIFEKLALLPECAIRDGKLWMIDYDEPNVEGFLRLLKKYEITVDSTLPTPKGYHIVIKPFNFRRLGSSVDSDYNYDIEGFKFGIKFDCNVLLYYGK